MLTLSTASDNLNYAYFCVLMAAWFSPWNTPEVQPKDWPTHHHPQQRSKTKNVNKNKHCKCVLVLYWQWPHMPKGKWVQQHRIDNVFHQKVNK